VSVVPKCDRTELAGHFALDTALVTDRKLWPRNSRKVETNFGAVSVATAWGPSSLFKTW